MAQAFNIYCDESCHLENDGQPVMTLGAVWCPTELTKGCADRLREIKARHGLPPTFEVKWSKVMTARLPFYLDYLDYFFDDDDLHFRCLVADKTQLNHAAFHQTHDDWYYKMYFEMLKATLKPQAKYRIFVDIKDTRSAEKVTHLRDVLCNNLLDFDRQVIELMQTVRSHEVELLQLADMLIGAVAYANRGLGDTKAKPALIERIRHRSKYSLTKTTLLKEDKFNVFVWRPQTA